MALVFKIKTFQHSNIIKIKFKKIITNKTMYPKKDIENNNRKYYIVIMYLFTNV